MKFDFLKNKVFIISFIVLILFSFFNCNVFASSPSMNSDYDYLYTYTTSQDEEIKNRVDKIVKDDRVLSGDYSYFVGYHSGAHRYYSFLIKNSDLSNVLYLHYGNWSINGGWNPFYFDFPESSCVGFDGDVITDDFSGVRFVDIYGKLDENSKIWIFPFASNFSGNILVQCHNNTTRDFFLGAPTFTLTKEVGQIPEIMMKIIKQVLPIGLIVLGIGLLIYLIRRVIYSMK